MLHIFCMQQIKSSIEELKGGWSQLTERAGDALIFTILSHGDAESIYTYDGKIHLEYDIIRKFTTICYALKGKPKLFFIQACRVGRYSKLISMAQCNALVHVTPMRQLSTPLLLYIFSPQLVSLYHRNGPSYWCRWSELYRIRLNGIYCRSPEIHGKMKILLTAWWCTRLLKVCTLWQWY